jgi:hypothetical protein
VIATLAVLTLSFLALHFVVEKLTGQPFASAFRMGRGLASAVLTGVGFFGLFYYRAAWSTVYVLAAPDELALRLALVPVGHLLADFILLTYGFVVARSSPRKDLLAHHLMALVAAAATFRYPIAAPQFLVVFTSELMPVTSGVTAFGSYRRNLSLERLGARLRLVVLLGWRLPLWLLVAAQIALVVTLGNPSRQMKAIYAFSSAFLLVVLSLDAFWTLQSVRSLRRIKSEAETSARTT